MCIDDTHIYMCWMNNSAPCRTFIQNKSRFVRSIFNLLASLAFFSYLWLFSCFLCIKLLFLIEWKRQRNERETAKNGERERTHQIYDTITTSMLDFIFHSAIRPIYWWKFLLGFARLTFSECSSVYRCFRCDLHPIWVAFIILPELVFHLVRPYIYSRPATPFSLGLLLCFSSLIHFPNSQREIGASTQIIFELHFFLCTTTL